MDKLYVAYGSNMNLEQMALRCPDSKVVASALMYGYELQFKYYATIEPNPDSKVPILLWKLSERDEKQLDRYEGFPKYYRKETKPFTFRGETVEGMMYIMNGNKPLQAPSEQYYNTILQGYKAAGLDTSYLETALAQAQELGITEDLQLRF
jgi:gamma-glutamylcyclotransferase (GGCT)/AIG2-like uncharacterized protein YtfP